jgi:hypothetical protein
MNPVGDSAQELARESGSSRIFPVRERTQDRCLKVEAHFYFRFWIFDFGISSICELS